MPEFGYSWRQTGPAEGIVRASIREVRMSGKDAMEVAAWIRGMKTTQARTKLGRVLEKRNFVPFRRHKKKVPHRADATGFYSGRYPMKVASHFLKLIDTLEANAQDRGLDPDNLRIIHASAYVGRKIVRYTPRAFGRTSPKIGPLVHVELVAREAT